MPSDIAGQWDLDIKGKSADIKFEIDIKEKGDDFEATAALDGKEAELNSFKFQGYTFTATLKAKDGLIRTSFAIKGELNGDEMSGTAVSKLLGEFTFAGRRL
ncbi:MAG: hypothetical protein FWG30_07415 [Eubacteriaceae bacterium]|jgi:hypothetical protein|nr:hypothetical protein [Eubacteriaceae bacterium]